MFASMPGRTESRSRPVDVNHGWHVQLDDDGDGFEPSNGGSVPGHLGLTALRKPAQNRRRLVEDRVPPVAREPHLVWLPGVQQAPEFMLARLSA